jgi:hypothetical protein
MDQNDRIQCEIKRQRKLIEDCELIMDQVPSHLREYQKVALNYHKEILAKLENMQTKKELENKEIEQKHENNQIKKENIINQMERKKYEYIKK